MNSIKYAPNPGYVTTGVANNAKIDSLLDTSAMYKTPAKALPKLVALTTNYAETEKYVVGKKVNVDATFTYPINQVDLTNIKWEITPADALREVTVAVKPDPKTLRKVYIPQKAGIVTIKAAFTDANQKASSQSIQLNIEESAITAPSLGVTHIVSMLFEDPTLEAIKIGTLNKVNLVFDRPMPTNEEISIIGTDNVMITKLTFTEDRSGASFVVVGTAPGYANIKAGTTGTPYVGFDNIPVIKNEAVASIVSITPPQTVTVGDEVSVFVEFDRELEGDAIEGGWRVIIKDPSILKRTTNSMLGKIWQIDFEAISEGTTEVEIRVSNGEVIKTLVSTSDAGIASIIDKTQPVATTPKVTEEATEAVTEEETTEEKVK